MPRPEECGQTVPVAKRWTACGLGLSAFLASSLPAPYSGWLALEIASTLLVVLSSLGRDQVQLLALHVRVRKPIIPISLFITYAAVSSVWSPLSGVTLRGCIPLVLTLIVGMLGFRILGISGALRATGDGFRLLLMLSVCVAFASPAIGRTQEVYQQGSLKGLFDHRNLMADVAVVSLVTFYAEWRDRRSLTPLISIGLACVCCIWTQSQTCLVVGAASLFGVMLYSLAAGRPARRRTGVLIGLGAVLGVGAWIGLTNLSVVAEGLGRDATLTGRTMIWSAVIQEIGNHPLRGVGWNALWHPGTDVTERLWYQIGFQAFHAHDGYLDLLLQVGVLGSLPVFGLLIWLLVRALQPSQMSTAATRLWLVGLLLTSILGNITESRLNAPLGWFQLVVLSIGLLDARYNHARGSSQEVSQRMGGLSQRI